jgi:twitching motility protein PilT
MNIEMLLEITALKEASDLHVSIGARPTCRINGRLVSIDEAIVTAEDTNRFVEQLLTPLQYNILDNKGEYDTSITIKNKYRFRLNVYRRRGEFSFAFRLVNSDIDDFQTLGLPSRQLEDLCRLTHGLILVSGPTGTGKSTTLAAMIDWINRNRDCHIITLEEPIEYVHNHNKSIVDQREIGIDSLTFQDALRAALRQDPDVILIGEMRDLETISIALTAAETGHLVVSTLHTIGASKTIDRIIDVFPPYQQQQIRVQLAMVLQAVISQQLIPTADNQNRVPALEIMIANGAIRNLIRENKTHQIANSIQTSLKIGMKTMDMSLVELCKAGKITIEDVFTYCLEPDAIKKAFST